MSAHACTNTTGLPSPQSQLELALETGVSARHLSFIETGRSRPSAEMVLHLTEGLEVPLRERSRMLLAAGHAPVFEERALDDPEMAPVRDALRLILDGHDPYPAVVVDRTWEMIAWNRAVALLTEGVSPELMQPPVNVLRVSPHPDGVAPRIANLAEWRAHILERLRRQIAVAGDAAPRHAARRASELSGAERTAAQRAPPIRPHQRHRRPAPAAHR